MSNVIHFFSHLLSNIIIFFLLFFYLFPLEFTFLPFSMVRIVQILGLFYFCFSLLNRKLPNSVLAFWGFAIIISCVGLYSTSVFNHVNDFSVINVRGIYVFLYTVSAYLIISIIRRTTTNANTFFTLVEWIVFATVIYALISFAMFLNHDLFSLYEKLIAVNDNTLVKNESLLQVRLIGLSNNVQYANAAVFYGIVMWAAIFAYKSKQTFLFRQKWSFYTIISLFVIAGLFSGRTFFIILLMTILYLFLLNDGIGFLKTIKEFFAIFSPVILIVVLGISYILSSNEDAMEWAFELFINMMDGEIRSDSTDQLGNMLQILPDNPYTWLIGDGRAENADGSFYMNTDSGYLRSFFYWGSIGTFIYFMILYGYYRILKKSSQIPNLKVYFLVILLFTYIYNIKEFYQPVSFYVLYLMALVEFPKRSIHA